MNEQLDVAQLKEGRRMSNSIVLKCDVCTVYLVQFIIYIYISTIFNVT